MKGAGMTKVVLAIAVLACPLLLAATGCSARPSETAIVERFAIELAAPDGEPDDWREVAELLAGDAMDGLCGSDYYRTGIGDQQPELLYAWSATCLMYFEDDMSPAQIDLATQDVVEHTIARLDN